MNDILTDIVVNRPAKPGRSYSRANNRYSMAPMRYDETTLKMEDIAREAGVSIATVSRAFNQPSLVSPSTLARVKQVADRLRYTPNLTAGSLAGNRSRIVAAVIPTITNSIFPRRSTAFPRCSRARLSVAVGPDPVSDDQQAALIETFLGRRVDGLALTEITRDKRLHTRLKGARIPIVETWDLGASPIDMLVGFSTKGPPRHRPEYLIGRGYSRLGSIGGLDQRSGARLDGFCAAAAAAGLAPPGIVRIASPSPSSVLAGAEARRTAGHAPDIDAVSAATT